MENHMRVSIDVECNGHELTLTRDNNETGDVGVVGDERGQVAMVLDDLVAGVRRAFEIPEEA
jgi:hypothetical protein